MLKVWGRRNSQNVQKVMWLIGELALDHEHIDAGGDFGGLNAPDFLARNPHGRVPVIEDENGAVWESHAILRYLAAKHGGDAWWPDDLYARSRVDRWVEWGATTLQPAFIDVFWGFYRTPEAQRNQVWLEGAFNRCHAAFRALDKQLDGRDHILGDDFSLADIPSGAALFRYFTMPIDRPALPNVAAYYDRLQARPAFREHVMVAYDDLFGKLGF